MSFSTNVLSMVRATVPNHPKFASRAVPAVARQGRLPRNECRSKSACGRRCEIVALTIQNIVITLFERSNTGCNGTGCNRRHVLNRFVVKAEEERKVVYNKEFGYSRKDVIILSVGILAVGYAMYYGLQALGVEQGMAGSYTQFIIFVVMTVGWVGSYIFRVATKVCPFLVCPWLWLCGRCIVGGLRDHS